MSINRVTLLLAVVHIYCSVFRSIRKFHETIKISNEIISEMFIMRNFITVYISSPGISFMRL